MTIDIDKLRESLKEESYGAFFGGGFGGALMESFEIDKMSDEEILDYAQKHSMSLEDYLDDK